MNKKYKGIIYIIISAFCFAFMNMFVHMSGDLPSIQKSFFRNFVAASHIRMCSLIERRSPIPVQGRKPSLYAASLSVWNGGDFVQFLCG